MRRVSSFWAVGAALGIVGLVSSAHAQSICESMKVKASGKMFACVTNAFSKAYKKGVGVLPETLTKCETKFSVSCAKGVQRGDCDPTTKDCLDLQADLMRSGLVFSKDSCANPPAQMFAWWPLDEQAGNPALDIEPETTADPNDVGNHAIRQPGTVPIVGKHGLAMSGSAVAPEVNAHNPNSLTLDAWVHDNDGSIIFFGDGTNYYELLLSSGSLYFFEQCAGSQKSTEVHPGIASGVWTHVVFVADAGADTVTFYVNGVAQGASPSTYSGTGLTLNQCNTIGNPEWRLGGFSGFNGLDEVEVFERPLTQNEINFIYLMGKGKCKPPCM